MSTIDLPCLQGSLDEGTPVGRESVVADLPTYITGTTASNSDKCILFITDVFGWHLPNARLLADAYARESGIPCHVPDFLFNDAIDFQVLQEAKKDPVKMGEMFGAWKVKHTPEMTMPAMVKYVEALHGQGVKKIAAIGYCWGGKYSVLLAKQGLIEAYVACHPSMLDVPDDFQNWTTNTVPGLFLCPEDDHGFDLEHRKQVAELKRDTVTIKLWKGVHHGFAIRGDPSNPVEMKAKTEAAQEAIAFFKKHLV